MINTNEYVIKIIQNVWCKEEQSDGLMSDIDCAWIKRGHNGLLTHQRPLVSAIKFRPRGLGLEEVRLYETALTGFRTLGMTPKRPA